MINRDLYKGYFTKEQLSQWQCPTCLSSVLQTNDEKFLMEHNSATEINYNEDWFDASEMITNTFTTLLSCANSSCKEVVTCSGTACIETENHSYYGREDRVYVEYFKPYFFYPSLQIFNIPDKTPDEIKKTIETSFSIIFKNKSAAANQIRIALECLLTALKIKRFNVRPGQKRRRLNLHQRIDLLPSKYQEVKNICLAIKWLGNSGSHCDEDMKFDDVFNGYDMLSFLLDEIYDNRHHHVKKLAKTINAKKGV